MSFFEYNFNTYFYNFIQAFDSSSFLLHNFIRYSRGTLNSTISDQDMIRARLVRSPLLCSKKHTTSCYTELHISKLIVRSIQYSS